MSENEVGETIYINNLNEKVSVNTLKRALEDLFKQYGNIIQITAHKNVKMKGQAFITFDTIESAKKAVEAEKDHKLFDRTIKVDYARTNSDNYYSIIRKDEAPVEKRKELKARRKEDEKSKLEREGPPTKKAKINDWASLPANEILLIQNLSAETTNDSLSEYFEQFTGFINARYVKIRNLAFLEFENDTLSTKCLEDSKYEILQEKFGTAVILTYAKR